MTDLTETHRRSLNISNILHRYGTLAILIALLIVATSMSNVFLTERNLLNVLRQISGTSLMAVGMLFVILTRGIDLSVGSIAALGSVISAILIQKYGTGVALGSGLIAGAACGLISGLLIAYLKLPPFVTTLAMMTIARGLSLIISAGQPILMGDSGAAVTAFGSGTFGSIPYPIILMGVVFLIAGLVLTFTRFGRLVKAIGSNLDAVRLSGIPVGYYTMAVYVISGILAAAAGIVSTSRTGIGSANIGVGAELDAIAAVVIGGASLMGGRGGVINTFIGVIVLGIIANMMNLARVPGYHQQVFMGCIIIGAMLLQYASNWFRK
ncbi:ABC transporter permease [Phyllobacterium sp. SB3]|uniref:ABC transporter permease n=1 Tax=Phyllobacterium sp. SB3 TaxID=3156073 RepID=UPI0032AF775B